MNEKVEELVEASKLVMSMAYGCEMEKRRRREGRTPHISDHLIRGAFALAFARLAVAVNAVELAEKLKL
jgi:hypothetical protein